MNVEKKKLSLFTVSREVTSIYIYVYKYIIKWLLTETQDHSSGGGRERRAAIVSSCSSSRRRQRFLE